MKPKRRVSAASQQIRPIGSARGRYISFSMHPDHVANLGHNTASEETPDLSTRLWATMTSSRRSTTSQSCDNTQ
jgi:hypothetical protein